jgi:ATP dependent DNA ligase domain
MAARIDNGRVQLLTRTGLDWTAKYPSAVAALANLNVKTAYIDGELCGVDDAGLPNFAQTQAATDGERDVHLVYYAFDLLHLRGYRLMRSEAAGNADHRRRECRWRAEAHNLTATRPWSCVVRAQNRLTACQKQFMGDPTSRLNPRAAFPQFRRDARQRRGVAVATRAAARRVFVARFVHTIEERHQIGEDRLALLVVELLEERIDVVPL